MEKVFRDELCVIANEDIDLLVRYRYYEGPGENLGDNIHGNLVLSINCSYKECPYINTTQCKRFVDALVN